MFRRVRMLWLLLLAKRHSLARDLTLGSRVTWLVASSDMKSKAMVYRRSYEPIRCVT